MAQIIEKIVRSKYPPRDTRVLWLDETTGGIKSFNKEGWEASGITSATITSIQVVEALPENPIEGILYLVLAEEEETVSVQSDVEEGE